MPEPVTLATLGASALTQGITFLYGQATELLKRHRDRKDAAGNASVVPPPLIVDAPVLVGKLRPVEVDEQVVEARSEELLELTERLSSYVSGVRKVDTSNAALIAQVESLRGLLELAYQQRITFNGEKREPTGSAIDAKLVTTRVDGELTVAEIKRVMGGSRVRTQGELGEVGPGAKVTGFRGDVVGG